MVLMVEQSVFRGVIDFFHRLGIYDVVLPFLLVFAMVFAVFEKTKVFGTEKVNGVEYAKKNINAMVAFCISFMVVASSQLVSVINEALPNVVILIIMSVMFLVLVGTFYHEKEDFKLGKNAKTLFMVLMFIGILLIFANAIKIESGESWLQVILDYLFNYWDTTVVASVVLLIVVLGFMWYVTYTPKSSSKKED